MLWAGAAKVEAALSERPWVAGSSYSLADIDFFNFCGFMAAWMPEVINKKDTPATVAWLKTMEARPAVQKMRSKTSRMFTRPAASQVTA